MTRSVLDVLALAVDGEAVDLADHALADMAGTDVALALELGWASLPPTLAAQLTPPGDVPTDLDAGASDLLAAVLVHPPELAMEIDVDERWGAGGDDGPAAFVHDIEADAHTVSPWAATHDLDDMSLADAPHDAHEATVVDDADDDLGDDPDPWDDDALL